MKPVKIKMLLGKRVWNFVQKGKVTKFEDWILTKEAFDLDSNWDNERDFWVDEDDAKKEKELNKRTLAIPEKGPVVFLSHQEAHSLFSDHIDLHPNTWVEITVTIPVQAWGFKVEAD